MTKNKVQLDKQKKLNELVRKLKAIAHPIRLEILELLQKEKKLTVTEIYLTLNLEQAITSHHLGILREKGIVDAVRKGKNIYYVLKLTNISGILELFS